ncbi:MAG: hypothetical protein ABI321_22775 [Polyangia bacterium]
MTDRAATQFVEWTSQLAADLDATFVLTGDERIATQGRRFLAGALSYSLQQLDIIPDHEEAGSVDDAIVLRIAFGLAAEHAASASVDTASLFARMTNQEDQVRAFLGDALFAKVRRLVVDLADKPVRGRTSEQVIVPGRPREDMKRELDAQAKRIKKASVADDAAAQEAFEVSVKSWFSMKLI